jgi:hypothetical protein
MTRRIVVSTATLLCLLGPSAGLWGCVGGDRPRERAVGSGVPSFTPGAPTPESLTSLLGVQVDGAPGEVNQYLIRAEQGTVDLSKVGTIHQDLGYAVGVTLANGVQIGLRYEPLAGQSDAAESGAEPK